jgi:hypothetical protein
MKMLKMCLNWKVLASLAVVAVGVYLVAPGLLAETIPILLLAACPLSMVLMMWAMQRTPGQDQQTPLETDAGPAREERFAQMRAEQAALADRIGALERKETRSAENGRRRVGT